jgi:hypothetical protein
MTKAEMITKLLNKFNLTETQATSIVETLENGDDVFHVGTFVFEVLFKFYCDNGEMPYGTATAKDGDPYEWITNALRDELGMVA